MSTDGPETATVWWGHDWVLLAHGIDPSALKAARGSGGRGRAAPRRPAIVP
jgi:hypothetical protein